MRYQAVRSPALLRVAARTAILYWFVLSLTFALLRLAPGDPATFLLPPGATAAEAARMRAELGLDRPVAVQYVRWLRATLHADLGTSFADGRPVWDVIRDALPVSLGLGLVSLLLSFAAGTVLGLVQAARRGSLTDVALTVVSVFLAASPAYWLGCSELDLSAKTVRAYVRRLTVKNVMSVGRPAEYRRRDTAATRTRLALRVDSDDTADTDDF